MIRAPAREVAGVVNSRQVRGDDDARLIGEKGFSGG